MSLQMFDRSGHIFYGRRQIGVLCIGQNFAVPEHMITVSETDAISRQMYAVSGTAKSQDREKL